MDGEDVQAVVEILAEAVFRHAVLEVPAGGRQDPDVHVDRLVAADAFEGLLLEEAQELDLHGKGYVSDFVEEERSAAGYLEASLALADGPVKEPFSWPKSSLSMRFSGRAAQFNAMKGLDLRGLAWWMARATSSLPVPDSPRMRTVAELSATCEIIA
jgi:hypothetical protein